MHPNPNEPPQPPSSPPPFRPPSYDTHQSKVSAPQNTQQPGLQPASENSRRGPAIFGAKPSATFLVCTVLAILFPFVLITSVMIDGFTKIEDRRSEIQQTYDEDEEVQEQEVVVEEIPTNSADASEPRSSIASKLDLYHTRTGAFPSSIDQFAQQSPEALTPAERSLLSSAYIPENRSVVNLVVCDGNSGAFVEYWSEEFGRVDRQMVPANANPNPPCSVLPQ